MSSCRANGFSWCLNTPRGTLADLYRKLVANKDTDPFMEEAEARYYYHDIMNGLEYLHRHNIAHR